ncbi:acetyltransferase [Enterococcus gallinarum]|uniref:Acetyltransferase n=2 Tax=Enterococcus gallinarum TaxID=1353 RepID=A0ABD4ZPV7_ENTGA|nr:acetyltransferase [Enterococcus gallinarum]MBF0822271.1 acetyltransferase [Enterococcus faecalis]MBA0949882.1 acetyltransferase [Enterococcus gallinarum]MBA0962838.1 acetyltransferase [Enterococcus gallinarum]MBA0970775.1 acetyltransferase [Enterococcus gallinarum]MBA0974208.1 acetyltransferase [Enterococcus gallinarum]
MKDLVIIGAGGYAKEISFLVQNRLDFNLIGFVDDSVPKKTELTGKKVLGPVEILLSWPKSLHVAIGISSPVIKKKIYLILKENKNIIFPNIIDPTALIGANVTLGIGNILMPHTTFTADINIGNFNMINIATTIGHDTKIGDFNSIFPSCNISGNVKLGDYTEIGVGTKIIPGISIADNSITGAGSVVIRNIEKNTKNVGVPTRVIERWN